LQQPHPYGVAVVARRALHGVDEPPERVLDVDGQRPAVSSCPGTFWTYDRSTDSADEEPRESGTGSFGVLFQVWRRSPAAGRALMRHASSLPYRGSSASGYITG
ncbi:hypothetical protein, partial [Streptomyces sp. NPDC002769]|uniref:hypothetical protein n=1 Tax=Streptomyces sp. NPDC002769 TaxID=3154542 RepID=UPI00332431C3